MKKISVPKINIKAAKLPKVDVKKIKMPKITIRKDFFFAVMAYLPVLVVVSLFLKRRNYFVEYHVRQGLALIVVEVLFLFSFYVPVLPYLLAMLVIGLFVVGIVNIATRKEKPLPLVGKWAENINI